MIGFLTEDWIEENWVDVKSPILVKITYKDNSEVIIETLEEVEKTERMTKKDIQKLRDNRDLVILIKDGEKSSRINSFDDLLEEMDKAEIKERGL